MVATVINVDLDLQFFPRDFVTRFVQPAPACRRPQHRKLCLTQTNLAFFARRSPSYLERQKSGIALFPKTNVPSPSFVREITLGNPEMTRAQNFNRQMPNQKFSLDFAR